MPSKAINQSSEKMVVQKFNREFGQAIQAVMIGDEVMSVNYLKLKEILKSFGMI